MAVPHAMSGQQTEPQLAACSSPARTLAKRWYGRALHGHHVICAICRISLTLRHDSKRPSQAACWSWYAGSRQGSAEQNARCPVVPWHCISISPAAGASVLLRELVAGHRIVTALRELRRWSRLVGVAGEPVPGVPRPPRPTSTSPNGVRPPALEVGVVPPCRGSRDRCRIRGGSSGLPMGTSAKSRFPARAGFKTKVHRAASIVTGAAALQKLPCATPAQKVPHLMTPMLCRLRCLAFSARALL